MLFVSDEKSALLWLFNFLKTPKTFSDIHTAFTQISSIHDDDVPELEDIDIDIDFYVVGSQGRSRHCGSATPREETATRSAGNITTIQFAHEVYAVSPDSIGTHYVFAAH